MAKVYKVKNTKTGLFRTAGGGWSKSGKTWNNLGHLKNSLSNYCQRDYRSGDYYYDLPEPHVLIIEIEVVETESNTKPMRQMIEEQRRFLDLKKKYGSSFADLVERIEKDNQRDLWQWVLLIPYAPGRSNEWENEMLSHLKNLKLKTGSDFRKAHSSNSGLAIAFKEKRHAMQVRLCMNTDAKIVGLDIKEFVETDLDS